MSPITAWRRIGATSRAWPGRDDGQRFPWVRDLLEILDNSTTGDDFLENTKLELYQDQVFCFTPKGS